MPLGEIEDAKRPPRPNPNFHPTSAQAQGYAARKVAAIEASAEVTSTAIAAFGAVAKEVVGVAKANPIMGIFLAVVGADMLAQAHLISQQTKAFVFTVCGIAFGVEVGLEVVEGVGAIIAAENPFSKGGQTTYNPADLIRPTPTTLVENPSPPKNDGGGGGGAAGAGALAALIPKAVPPVPA